MRRDEPEEAETGQHPAALARRKLEDIHDALDSISAARSPALFHTSVLAVHWRAMSLVKALERWLEELGE